MIRSLNADALAAYSGSGNTDHPGADNAGNDMKAMKHFRNVCVGVCLMAGSVYYGGVPGFVLGALGIALIIHSSNAQKSE